MGFDQAQSCRESRQAPTFAGTYAAAGQVSALWVALHRQPGVRREAGTSGRVGGVRYINTGTNFAHHAWLYMWGIGEPADMQICSCYCFQSEMAFLASWICSVSDLGVICLHHCSTFASPWPVSCIMPCGTQLCRMLGIWMTFGVNISIVSLALLPSNSVVPSLTQISDHASTINAHARQHLPP